MAILPLVRSRAPKKSGLKQIHPIVAKTYPVKAPTKNPVPNPKAVPLFKAPVAQKPAPTVPQSQPVKAPTNPGVPVSSGSPTATNTNPVPTDAATAFLQGQRKSADLQNQQNLKDLMDFQNWYSKQSDTAEGFLKQQFASSTKATQDYAAQALAAAQAITGRNNQDIIQGTPEAQLTQQMGQSYLADQAAGTSRAQTLADAGAMLSANQRSVDAANIADLRGKTSQQYNSRLSDIAKSELENIYRQQQLRIDAATAEALGAKNAGELDIAKYKAETDRRQQMSTAEYNRQRLMIDQQYKQGQLTNEQRKIELDKLALQNSRAAKNADAKAKLQQNKVKSQRDARALADKMLKEANTYYKTKFPKIGGWSNALPLSTRANYLGRVFSSIRNDYPDLSTLDIFNAMKAVYGVNAVALIENKFAGGFN